MSIWIEKQVEELRNRIEKLENKNTEELDHSEFEVHELKHRMRFCTQQLIEEIGSDGPENLEDTIRRAVLVIQRLKNESKKRISK